MVLVPNLLAAEITVDQAKTGRKHYQEMTAAFGRLLHKRRCVATRRTEDQTETIVAEGGFNC